MFSSALLSLLIAHTLGQTLGTTQSQIYMIGINKDTIQELMDKNLRVMLDHVDQEMDDHLRFRGDDLQSEVLFD